MSRVLDVGLLQLLAEGPPDSCTHYIWTPRKNRVEERIPISLIKHSAAPVSGGKKCAENGESGLAGIGGLAEIFS
jgi:hypothetical protein